MKQRNVNNIKELIKPIISKVSKEFITEQEEASNE